MAKPTSGPSITHKPVARVFRVPANVPHLGFQQSFVLEVFAIDVFDAPEAPVSGTFQYFWSQQLTKQNTYPAAIVAFSVLAGRLLMPPAIGATPMATLENGLMNLLMSSGNMAASGIETRMIRLVMV